MTSLEVMISKKNCSLEHNAYILRISKALNFRIFEHNSIESDISNMLINIRNWLLIPNDK